MASDLRRKPPVIAIRGSAGPDRVTQYELSEIAKLQGALWSAERAVHLSVEQLRARLDHGASIEEGELEFDTQLKMVRRRKTG